MNGTLTGPENAEDPAVRDEARPTGSRKKRGARKRQAALLPEDELVDDVDDGFADDDLESEDAFESDEADDLESEDFESDDDESEDFEAEAGLLLDDEPRLSLR
jgi:hypothetical protein